MKCKYCGSGMTDIARISHDYSNHYCHQCKAHFEGATGKEKWWTRKEWDTAIEEAYESERTKQ